MDTNPNELTISAEPELRVSEDEWTTLAADRTWFDRTPQIDQLATALAAAQGEIQVASIDATNPYYNSRYATLASVMAAARVPLSRHGLAVLQFPETVREPILLRLTTILTHKSGQYVRSTIEIAPLFSSAKGERPTPSLAPQAIGSAISYARRYGLAALIGVVADEDDDGEGASGRRDSVGTRGDGDGDAAGGRRRRNRADRGDSDSGGPPLDPKFRTEVNRLSSRLHAAAVKAGAPEAEARSIVADAHGRVQAGLGLPAWDRTPPEQFDLYIEQFKVAGREAVERIKGEWDAPPPQAGQSGQPQATESARETLNRLQGGGTEPKKAETAAAPSNRQLI